MGFVSSKKLKKVKNVGFPSFKLKKKIGISEKEWDDGITLDVDGQGSESQRYGTVFGQGDDVKVLDQLGREADDGESIALAHVTEKGRIVLLVAITRRTQLDDEDVPTAGLPRLIDVVPHHFRTDATHNVQRARDVHIAHVEC